MKVFLLLGEMAMSVSQLVGCIGDVDHRSIERVIHRLLLYSYIVVDRTEVSPKNRKQVPYYGLSAIGATLFDYGIWERGLKSVPFPDPIDPNTQFNLSTGIIDNTKKRRERMLPRILEAAKSRDRSL